MKDHVEIQQSNCIKVVKTVHRFLKDLKNAKLTLASKNQSYILKSLGCSVVAGLPAQYIFMLACCYKPECCHVKCKAKPTSPCKWYSEGPTVTMLPLPTVDEERPWGGTTCNQYKGTVQAITRLF